MKTLEKDKTVRRNGCKAEPSNGMTGGALEAIEEFEAVVRVNSIDGPAQETSFGAQTLLVRVGMSQGLLLLGEWRPRSGMRWRWR